MLIQVIANAAVSGSVYALTALGFGVIYRSTKIFHFAHAAVYTASAYVLYVCVVLIGFPKALSIVLAVTFAMLLGCTLERFVYYPLVIRKASTGVVLVSAIGVYTVSVNVIAAIFGNDGKVISTQFSPSLTIGTALISRTQLSKATISIVLCAAVLAFIEYSSAGRLIQAIVDNEALLSVIGIDARRIRLMCFGLGSALAGTAACLLAFDVGVDPYTGLNILLISAISVIVGGLHSYKGALVGGYALALLQHSAAYALSTRWEQPAAFILLVGVLLFRPTGILGRRERLEEES
jgi:branched-chain amino acid transport system permease protein